MGKPIIFHYLCTIMNRYIAVKLTNKKISQFDIGNVNEKRQYSRYATHWLLTAITGSDYIDRPDPNNSNRSNTFNKEDYGYWVELRIWELV